MKKPLAASITCISAMLAGPSYAQEGCFARTYDDAHLAAYPEQVVRDLRIFFTADASRPGSRYADITARMAQQGHALRRGVGDMTLEEFALCNADGACRIACDGGAFRIIGFDGTELEIQTRDARLSAQPCTAGVVSTLADSPGEITTYRLARSPDTVCGR